jgi:hypothetical protein
MVDLRRKWLAFYALERLTAQRRVEPASVGEASPRPWTHFALWLVAGLLVGVCGLNDAPFASAPQLQAVAHAGFCLLIGGLYALYMLTTLIARFVLFCADEHPAAFARMPRAWSLPMRVPASDPDDDDDDVHATTATQPNHASSSSSRTADEDDAYYEEDDDNEADNDFDVLRRHRRQTPHHLPREVLIASMYFGGLGAFLALGPLCMWNAGVTLAFLSALLGMAIVFETPGASLTWLLLATLTLTIGCAAGVELTMPPLVYREAPTPNSTRLTMLLESHWPQWPFMLLASASPLLLYVGMGAMVMPSMRAPAPPHLFLLTPSKTLETGLPVSLLLACIVLSWFNPLETAILPTLLLASHLRFHILMVATAPVLFVATLAFLLHALRSRLLSPAIAALTSVFVVRQGVMHLAHSSSRPRSMPFLMSAALALAALSLALAVARLRLVRRRPSAPA